MKVSENHQAYWQKNLRITGDPAGIWFVVTFVWATFARDLNFNSSAGRSASGSVPRVRWSSMCVIIWYYART
jgi:uncharacterized membrane protein